MTNDRKGIPVSEIADALNEAAEEMAPRILEERPTKRTRGELRFFPKGGLKVTLSGPKRGTWFDWGSGEGGDMLDLVRWATGRSKAEAIRWAKDELGLTDEEPKVDPEVRKREREERDRRRREEQEREIRRRKGVASFLWRTSGPVAGTPAEAYLARRGLDVPDSTEVAARHLDREALERMGLADEVPEGKELDALVVRATDPDGRIAAVQQVILDGDQKAPFTNAPQKISNGVLDSAAVKLGDPGDSLVLAEGPETGMSVRQATGLATWIVLGLHNLARVEIPDRVREVIVAVDLGDSGTGLAQAVRAAGLWQATGRNVRLALPTRVDGDFNDVIRSEGPDAVRRDVRAGVTSRDHREDGPLVVCDRPRDALAIWRSTGLQVRATVKPVETCVHRILEDVDRAIVVGRPGEPVGIAPGDVPSGVRIHEISTSHLTPEEVHLSGGEDAVLALMRTAVPLGRRIPSPPESVALAPDAIVVAVQSQRELAGARRLFPDAAVVAWRFGRAGEYAWNLVSGRRVVLAPAADDAAREDARRAAEGALRAGAADVHIIRWPTCVPGPGGWRGVRRSVPNGYDILEAVVDGWSRANSHRLLEMAVPHGSGSDPCGSAAAAA